MEGLVKCKIDTSNCVEVYDGSWIESEEVELEGKVSLGLGCGVQRCGC